MRKNALLGIAMLCSVLFLTNCEKESLVSNNRSTIEPTLKASSVSNSYIVVLKNDAITDLAGESYKEKKDKVKVKAEKLFTKKKIKSKTLKHVYGKAIKGFALDLTVEEVTAL